jgi:hypothetical protein
MLAVGSQIKDSHNGGASLNMNLYRTRSVKALLASTALGAFLSLFAAAPAYAKDDREKCRQKIEKTESKLDDAVRKHGERSHQADDQRRTLNNEREKCWNTYHSWWNGRDRQWHNDRDWDRDHDRDRDHDHDHDHDHDRDHDHPRS